MYVYDTLYGASKPPTKLSWTRSNFALRAGYNLTNIYLSCPNHPSYLKFTGRIQKSFRQNPKGQIPRRLVSFRPATRMRELRAISDSQEGATGTRAKNHKRFCASEKNEKRRLPLPKPAGWLALVSVRATSLPPDREQEVFQKPRANKTEPTTQNKKEGNA